MGGVLAFVIKFEVQGSGLNVLFAFRVPYADDNVFCCHHVWGCEHCLLLGLCTGICNCSQNTKRRFGLGGAPYHSSNGDSIVAECLIML